MGVEEDLGIPVNHVLQYIRENKGVDTAVIEVCLCKDTLIVSIISECMSDIQFLAEVLSSQVADVHVKYVIVSSVLNKRQLRHIGAGLASLCKHEYNAVWSDPVGANTGNEWVSLDTGTTFLNFVFLTLADNFSFK